MTSSRSQRNRNLDSCELLRLGSVSQVLFLALGLMTLQSRHKQPHRFVLALPAVGEWPAGSSDPRHSDANHPGFATHSHPEPEEDLTGRKKERAPLAAAPPASPLPRVDIVAEKEGERPPGPQSRPPKPDHLPDDWMPSREERQLAIEAGFDPEDLVQEFADWARTKAARSADWGASWRRWVRREPQFRRPRQMS